MIEKYYASHIKTQLDAAAINIMRPRQEAKISRSLATQRNLRHRNSHVNFVCMLYDGKVANDQHHAGVAESADAPDLSANLSARRETGDAELLKFGEP